YEPGGATSAAAGRGTGVPALAYAAAGRERGVDRPLAGQRAQRPDVRRAMPAGHLLHRKLVPGHGPAPHAANNPAHAKWAGGVLMTRRLEIGDWRLEIRDWRFRRRCTQMDADNLKKSAFIRVYLRQKSISNLQSPISNLYSPSGIAGWSMRTTSPCTLIMTRKPIMPIMVRAS